MIALAVNKLEKYYGADKILSDVTFEIQDSEKVGIVGSNGCGKSTLLKIIMGIEGHEKGTVSIRKGAALGYLEQIPVYPEHFKVIDVLNTAFYEVDQVYKALEGIEEQLSNTDEEGMDQLLSKYARLQAIYESLGGYEKEEKLSKVCSGFKINKAYREKLFSELSGGEKNTVLLGKILLQNPDILLLDEPSNHLDMESMEWLEAYLKAYQGVVVIVSHDRYFLDHVVTRIIEIEEGVSKSYKGHYTAFAEEKERQLELQMEAFLDQQKKIKEIEKSIAQLRDWGRRGDNSKFFKRAANMQRLLDKLQRINKPILEKGSISITASTVKRSGEEVVILENLYKSYGQKVILKNAQLLIRKGERTALIGANGCGKSTLIKILLGIEQADAGRACLGSSIKLGYLPQHITFGDEKGTVLECFRNHCILSEEKARAYLSHYMFLGEGVLKKVGSLSGGERSRLKLAMLMYEEVNFLVLDEPTNHLDIDSQEELEDCLRTFKGTILFVSHDRYLINNIAERVIELSQGLLTSYCGNYDYYKGKWADLQSTLEDRIEGAEARATKANSEKVAKEKEMGMPKIERKKYEKAGLEKQIEALEERNKQIAVEIDQHCNDYEKLGILYSERLSIEEAMEALIDEYLGDNL